MADNGDIVLKVSGDLTQVEKDFKSFQAGLEKNPPGKDAGEGFGGSFALNIIAVNQGIELLKKAFDFTKEIAEFARIGEEADATTKRFHILAEQAGLMPENLISRLEKSNNGLAEMDNILKSASQSVITFGDNANRIPEVFDLAKNASKIFGGEVVDNFERLSNAIAFGQQKTLRQFGIQIDVNRVQSEYARSLGLTVDFLSDAQKQQAILNAALEQGEKRYKNTKESLTPIADEMQRLHTASKELVEQISRLFKDTFGGAISSGFKVMTEQINAFTKALSGGAGSFGDFMRSGLGAKLEIKPTIDTSQLGPSGEAFLAAQKKISDKHIELNMEQQKKLEDLRRTSDNQMLADEQAIYQLRWAEMAADGLSKAELQTQINEEKLLEEEAYQEKLAKIEEDFLVLKTLDNEQYRQTIETAQELHKAKLVAIEEKATAKMAAMAKQANAAIEQALANGISQSIQTMVNNMLNGQNAFANFTNVLLGLAGDLAIQLGTMFIAAAIGIAAIGEINPAVALIAGAALIAVGTIMKSLSTRNTSAAPLGGGGGNAASGFDSGGPSQQVNTPENALTQPEERAKAQTGVQVIVQGNILNTRESALEIARVLNDSFDLNGTIVRANT